MLVGIIQNNHSNKIVDTDISGTNYKACDYFEAKIDLPREVERSLELTKSLWSKDHSVPLLISDCEDFKTSPGIVFKPLIKELTLNLAFDFPKSMLATRIFLGASNSKNDLIDYTKPECIHLSVYASRLIFPKNWEEIIVEHEDFKPSDKELAHITPVLEKVHVSMRWINGIYDDWSNSKKWFDEKEDEGYVSEIKRFNHGKTTYFESKIEKIKITFGSQRAYLQNIDSLERFAEQLGRKDLLAPLSEKNHSQNSSYQEKVPVIGYQNVQRIMNGFLPAITDEEMVKMSPLDATTLLFKQTREGQERFINS